MDTDWQTILKKGIALLSLIAIGSFLYTWISSPLLVTVTGTGTVSVPAAKATLSLTATESDASAAVAATNVKARVDHLKGILIASGIPPTGIVESQVRLIPAAAILPTATGYQATVSLGATTSQVKNLPTLVATLYENGAALVSQPVISVDNQGELEEEALGLALADARDQARQLAQKHRKLVRKVAAVTPVTSPLSSTVTSTARPSETPGQSAGTAPVNPETFEVTTVVQVSYRMW